jgi:two-component system nitrate/nitrite sensor histidine kinase NarX
MNIKFKFYFYLLAFLLLSLTYPLVNEQNNLLVGLIFIYIFLIYQLHKDFLNPLYSLQKWLADHKENPQKTNTSSLINDLNEESQHLYDDMEQVIQKQIQQLAIKTTSLETLYQITSELNKTRDINELVTSLLKTLINITNSCAGTVRLLDNNDDLYLVTSLGLIDKNGQEETIAAADCLCGDIALDSKPFVQFSIHTCHKCIGFKGQEKANIGTIFIPIRFQEKTLGIFNLFFDKNPVLDKNIRALLQTIANHIAIVLDKTKFEIEQQRINLTQERLSISHEIHDSLAQTLVSLNLQTTVLKKLIKTNKNKESITTTNEIEESIKQANEELRNLMKKFREGLDPRGLIYSLENLLNQFKKDTNINIFFQQKGNLHIKQEMEIQIFSIVQETLTNIKKHANAKNVRLLLSSNDKGNYLLIEDDGIGINKTHKKAKNSKTGNHIGLKIMQERATNINAKLTVESDNEGTQVSLSF